jgi:flagellar motor protein MotB
VSRPFFAAISAVAIIALTSCVSQEEYRRALADSDNLRAQRDALAASERGLRDENMRLAQEIEDLTGRARDASWIEDQKARLRDILANLDGGKMPDGVIMAKTNEGFGFSVEGSLLFASGQAVVTKAGEDALRALVSALEKSGRQVRVEGHTDNDPIRRSSWKSNLELSAARSLAVADFLIKAGLPSDRVSVAGYGEFRPAVTGASDQDKLRNRRVEILMLYTDSATADAAVTSGGSD